jgi:cobaltochelatase CobS
MIDLKTLQDELKAEKAATDQLIQDAVKAEVKKTQITFENLDPKLQSIIMSKSSESSAGAAIPTKNPMEGGKPRKKDDKTIIDKTFKQICDDLLVHNNVYLYGKAGTGKTVLAKKVADYLAVGEKDNYYILNCSQWTSPMQIIGGFSIRGYTDGQLELAWRYGGVLILDELPKLDPNTAGLLNDALSMAAEEPEIDENGNIIEESIRTITNGKGEKIKKNPNFMVIGAGNTDLKSVGANFSGNNRQDYSLVDRFTGSFYEIKEDLVKEYELTYKAVYNICQGLREFLQRTDDSVEAITLRSMLNFNRTYQEEMLRYTRSPLAFYPVGTTEEDKRAGKTQGKTLKDSIESFVNSLGSDRKANLENTAKFNSLDTQNVITLKEILIEAKNNLSLFIDEFPIKTGFDLKTGERIKKSK